MVSHETPAVRVRAVSALTPRSVAWLWPGRLALGKLAILDGDPGLGKSLLALDLCARLSTGRPFPDGSVSPGPANALVLNGEDGEEDTVRPRLQGLGADLERVFVLDRDDYAAGPLRLPAQLALLDEAVRLTQARLVVIDPIMAFLDERVLSMSDQSVRRLLYPLAQLAAHHGCVVLLIRHLNKGRGSRSLYRGSGSIAFLGACRSGWLVARDPGSPTVCVMAQLKNNLAAPQPSLAYQLLPRKDAPPALEWLGPSDLSADELLGGVRPVALSTPRDRARDFLEGFLEDGPRTTREVWEAAREQALSERTLNRAKADLSIRSGRVSIAGRQLTYWLLPDQQLPSAQAPADDPDSLEPWLAPLRQQYPSPTPLDEP
jgi:AAA domain